MNKIKRAYSFVGPCFFELIYVYLLDMFYSKCPEGKHENYLKIMLIVLSTSTYKVSIILLQSKRFLALSKL